MTGTAEWIGKCAYNALIEEVNTTPKPGLVDLYSNGAHTDMDAETFRRSAEALRPFFVKMAGEGLSFDGSAEELFMGLRSVGMDAEQAMYAATDGVNTHKGAIFTFGIFCAAAGRCLKEQRHGGTGKTEGKDQRSRPGNPRRTQPPQIWNSGLPRGSH